MKHWLAVLILVPVLMTGCSRENYLAEKEFYWAKKRLVELQNSTVPAVGLKALDASISDFEHIAAKYPSTEKAVESLFIIANLKLQQKNFDGARTALERIVQNHSGRDEWAPEARFQISQLYEMEGNWDLAEKTIWEIAEYHPLSRRGLNAPLLPIMHYKQANAVNEQNNAYARALDHYSKLLKELGPIENSATVGNFLALAHYLQGEWGEARKEWLRVFHEYPKHEQAPLALLAAAEVAWKREQFGQALEEYQTFFDTYPKHRLGAPTAVRIGMLYEERGEFEDARKWLNKALELQPEREIDRAADIKLLIAKTYQGSDSWEKAEQIYNDLEANYPLTVAGLQVPLMKYEYLSKAGEQEKANQVLDSALKHYQELEAQNPNSKIGAYAKRLTYSALAQKGDWDAMLAFVDHEIANEDIAARRGRWVFLKALITQNRLQDPEKAEQFYNEFLMEYPEHPLADLAKTLTQSLTAPADNLTTS